MINTPSTLYKELHAFCAKAVLPVLEPEELLICVPHGSSEHAWLSDFSGRWDAFMCSPAARQIALHTPIELAAAFVDCLHQVLSGPQVVRVRNGEAAPADLCDSNVVMAGAFLALHGRSSWRCSDVEEGRCTSSEEDADLALWNAAVRLLSDKSPAVWAHHMASRRSPSVVLH